MKGGLFVDNANLVVSLDYGKRRQVRLDFDLFHEVLAREASRLAGVPIEFSVRTLYASYRPDQGELRRRKGFQEALMRAGWSVDERPQKRYPDGRWEEKGNDVAIALDAQGMAYRKYIGAVAVVSDDSDFAALFERLPLDVKGFAVGWERSMARELRTTAMPIYLDGLLPEIEMGRPAAPLDGKAT